MKLKILVLVIVLIALLIAFLSGIVSVVKVKKNRIDAEYFYVFSNGHKKYREKCDNFWNAFKKFYVQTILNIILFNI